MRLNARILHRYDTAANWVSENPTLASGEMGVQTNGDYKMGDGQTTWNSLDFAGGAVELAAKSDTSHNHDHGALTGRDDDDHTLYLKADGSRELSGHLIPEMTGASGLVSARDIGSPTKKIRNLYVHGAYIDASSLYVNNKLVLQDDSGTITVSTDADQDLKIKTTGTGDVVFDSENEVNLIAKGGVEFTVPNDNPAKHTNFTNQSDNGNITFITTGTNSQVQFAAVDEIDLTAPSIDLNGDVNISGEIIFGTLHHHDLTGIEDDDHTLYIKADGTRAFTGKVVGISPTATNQLATKSYVDGVVQGLDWQESVLSITNNAGATETTGFRYISNETSGSWTIDNIYEWNGSSWDESVSTEGTAAWVEDEDVLYTFNGSNWVKFGSTITHENLNAVNGGTYRHLSSSQISDLTGGGDSSLHKHDDRYHMPEGSIISWVGGYFQNGSNGTFTNVLGNTVVAANALLNGNGWFVCDGAALNDGDSTIFNGAGRYLPNLTDDRFLMGDTTAGGIGGSNTMAHTHGVTSNVAVGNHTALTLSNHSTLTLSNHSTLALNNTNLSLSISWPSYSMPAHYHGKGTLNIASSGSHAHNIWKALDIASGTSSRYRMYSADDGSGRLTTLSASHPHTSGNFSGSVGNTSGSNGDTATTTSRSGGSLNGTTGNHKHTFSTNISSHSFSQNITSHSFSQNISNHSVTNNAVTSDAASNDENRPKYLACFYIMKVK